MYRVASDFFEEWKDSKYRKPLIVQGVRQVGKTYSVLEFGKKCFSNVAYLNFQTNPDLCRTFDEDISPSYLIPLISHICGCDVIAGKTLIFFDEVQLCERALTSLKYFCEQAPDYHVIAAGSLLGIAVNRQKFSFPVGKVDRYTMYPMNFSEFLIASGEGDTVRQIRECFDTDTPMPQVLHNATLKLYRQYLITGGMPEAVSRYVETDDFLQVRHVQRTILNDYLDDMSKYQSSSNEIAKTRLTYGTVSTQLSKKNTRFQYKIIKTGARAAEYENAIQWLISASLVSRIFRAEQIAKPLDNYKDIDDFKIYLPDCGLLCAQKEIFPDDVLFDTGEIDDFKGSLAENYVSSQLTANGFVPFYWRSEKGDYEIDFVISVKGKLIPVEVKSSGHVTSDSLRYYKNRFCPDYSIRISTKNFGFENGIKSIPLYAVFCITDEPVRQSGN
ncbi:MAG: ATP-binding protein [Sphaerochaetaceae bacterium]|nr:ATP-binding protein [Sphaerochaetaceae bacterium]